MTKVDGITYFGGADLNDDPGAEEVNANLVEERNGNRTIVRSKHSKTRYMQGNGGYGAFARESTKRPVFVTPEVEARNYEALQKNAGSNPHLEEKKVGYKTVVTWRGNVG